MCLCCGVQYFGGMGPRTASAAKQALGSMMPSMFSKIKHQASASKEFIVPQAPPNSSNEFR